MPLSQTNIKSRLNSALSNQNTPLEIVDTINEYRLRHEKVGLTDAEKAAKIDTFLDTDPSTWTVPELRTNLDLAIRNWDHIPV